MSKEPHKVQLPEIMQISAIDDLAQRLTELDAVNVGDVLLDGTQVTRIDAATLQLLAAFRGRQAKSGLKLLWHEPSEPLLRAAELLGMSSLLGLTE